MTARPSGPRPRVGWSRTDVDGDTDLLRALRHDHSAQRIAWLRAGEGFIADGVADRFEIGTGPGRVHRAKELVEDSLGRIERDGPDAASGPRPIAVGSFTFDEDRPGSVLKIPRHVLHRSGRDVTLVTVGDLPRPDGDPFAPALLGDPGAPLAPSGTGAAGRPRFAGTSTPDERWLEAVQEVLDAIGQGRASKVVLARDQSLWSRTPFDVTGVVAALAERFPSSFTFLVDGLVGASPELLVRRTGASIESLVLAGTAARGRTPEEDARLGEGLRSSEKDLAEHAHAVASVVDVLRPLCRRIDVPSEPDVLRLANVQHLATPVRASLATPLHVLDLVGLLHPTAAVGGTPRAEALELIRVHEGLDRGRYAGPVGWCDATGDGEWAIALRCAEIEGDRARLFAGAGIVEGSVPVEELRETWLKLSAMSGALAVTD